MRLTSGKGTATADSFLCDRTRHVIHWYARGFLTEVEVVHLIGEAVLCWNELNGGYFGRRKFPANSRDAV